MQNQNGNKKYGIKNLIIWGILGLFVLSGLVQGNVLGMRNPVIAQVGSQKIRASDIRKYMNLIKVPDDVDRSSTQVQNYIFMKALDLVIQRSLITQECRRLGFVISDQKVIYTIKKQSQFQENGEFSRTKFLSELSKLGFSEMQYKSIQKENLLHRQWFFLLESAYAVPSKISDYVAAANAQKRSGRYVEVQHSQIKVPKVDQAELARFYKKNSDLFAPKKRKIFKIAEFSNDLKVVAKINRMLAHGKFQEAADKFEAKMYESDRILPGQLPDELIRIIEVINMQIGKNSQIFTIGKKHYALYFIKEIQPKQPTLDQVEQQVRAEYNKQYIKSHISEKGHGWIQLADIRMGENYLGVPDFVIGALFLNKPGKVARYDHDGVTYFVVVDKVVNESVNEIQKKAAADYLSAGILNDVIFAAMNSLKIRYKISVLI